MLKFILFCVSFSFAASVLAEPSKSIDSDLVKAVVKADTNRVKALLDLGANVNVQHKLTGWSVLGIAAYYGHEDIVEIFIQKGANPNQRDVHFGTPLMKALTLGPYENKASMLSRKAAIVTKLLNAGADPYAVDGYGVAAWQMSAVDSHAEIQKVFRDAGITDTENVRLLTAIARNDSLTVENLILDGADPNYSDVFGWTPLRQAVVAQNRDMVKRLIASGAAVNSRFPQGWTALMIAAKHGNREIVESLLSAGASLKFINDAGLSAHAIAIAGGHLEIAKLLQK